MFLLSSDRKVSITALFIEYPEFFKMGNIDNEKNCGFFKPFYRHC